MPHLKLNRRSTASVHTEEEKWKKEDSTELTHAKKEVAQRVLGKLNKNSNGEKNPSSQKRKSSRSSNREKDQSRKSNKLSERVKDPSQKSSKLSERENNHSSRKSSKTSDEEKSQTQKSNKLPENHDNFNKNKTEKLDNLAEKEIDEEKADRKGQKIRLNQSASARRSSSESDLSDIQPEGTLQLFTF